MIVSFKQSVARPGVFEKSAGVGRRGYQLREGYVRRKEEEDYERRERRDRKEKKKGGKEKQEKRKSRDRQNATDLERRSWLSSTPH